jgi:hypothetical protein
LNPFGDFFYYGIEFVDDGGVNGVVELIESILGITLDII